MTAAGRGRRQGYNNYSIQEQMLLCENDETFEQTVDEATANEEQRGAVVAEQGLVAETNGGLEELGQRFAHENYAPDSDRESAGRGEEAANTEHHDGIPAGVRGSADDAENGDPPDTLAERPQGSIFTRDGVVDAALAAEFDLSQFSPDEDDEESSQPAQQRHLQSDDPTWSDTTCYQHEDGSIAVIAIDTANNSYYGVSRSQFDVRTCPSLRRAAPG
ncbi:hypothetical protein PF008_g30384 [Phytophthora fragariae]|uniref:Uncharacterized protein n=1 Tax=Phytophthora fragariae TaxID=53985 RepID=A0A6G0Q672_9STRA|nr:hypothetical protein PF003_g8609 [Phytophthora fragariae]KAE9271331.1 hypothetical protein PF008_g30384 [Phytophthora fragariae]